MFSTEESLRRRTGPLGTGRLKYLQALVTEYQDTSEKGILVYSIICTYQIPHYLQHPGTIAGDLTANLYPTLGYLTYFHLIKTLITVMSIHIYMTKQGGITSIVAVL